MKKRMSSLLLAVVTCLSLLCVPALAADETTYGIYDPDAGTVQVKSTDPDLTDGVTYKMIAVCRPNGMMFKGTSGTATSSGLDIEIKNVGKIDDVTDWKVVVMRNSGGVLTSGPLKLKENTTVYTITFDLAGGSGTAENITQVKAASGATTVELPDGSDLTAPSGKKFKEWTVTGTGLSITGNTLTIADTVEAGTITVTAVWETEGVTPVVQHTITASAGTGGSITPSGSVTVNDGDSKTFTVKANSNYVVDKVTVDGSTASLTGGKYTFTNVTDNHSISVTFRYTGGSGGSSSSGSGGSSGSEYSVSTPSRVTGGTVTVRPTSASAGSKVTITTKPNAGYEVGTITVIDKNGKKISVTSVGDGKYTFTMPKSKVDVKVEYVLAQTPPPVTNFTDVPANAWYYSAVQYVQSKNLMSGIGNGNFAPNSNLTRAQLAQVLYNASDRPSAGASGFTDVASGKWYTNAVSWAAQQGIVAGYGDGRFGPSDNITREQLAVMLWRYAGKPAPKSTTLSYTDSNKVSSYAVQALCWATESGIVSGYGNGLVGPQDTATRAQVAAMVMRFMER